MILLDTNVLSEAMSPNPDGGVRQYLIEQAHQELFTTSISLAEILYGIELLAAGKRRTGLLAAATSMFERLFPGRILPFDEDAARAFAPIAAERRAVGRPVSLFDAQIAAIARAREAILVTRNTSDFERCGLRLVNPWHT
jgi:hypothetical protein